MESNLNQTPDLCVVESTALFGVYSSFEVMGLTWKDCTAYSQNEVKKPRVWKAVNQGIRMSINKTCNTWQCRVHDYDMKWIEIKDVSLDDPKAAAAEAMVLIHHYFNRLARLSINAPNVNDEPPL